MMREQKGSAELLAIFTVFVILTSVVAINTFESGYTRQMNALQQRIAVDTTKAVASTVETELNDSLGTAITAAMFEVGKTAGSKAEVEARFRAYFNERIAAGWSFSNFENIDVPLSDENSLKVEWLPDGGVRAYGYLGATFTHATGAKAYGVKLDAGVAPRYGRMLYVAENIAYRQASIIWNRDRDPSEIAALQDELNDNFFAERFSFTVYVQDGVIMLTLNEDYGGRALRAENQG